MGFVLLALFYFLTAPENHSQADDAVHFAWDVEREPWAELFHPLHLFYLPVARVVWRGLYLIGGPERAYPILMGLSAVFAAAGIVVSWNLLVIRLRFDPRMAALAAGLLAFAYGVWRYAAEVEVYAFALLVSAGLVHLALADSPGTFGKLAVVLVGAVAPLTHILAAVASGVAVPIGIASRRGLRPALTYLAAAGSLGLVLAVMGFRLAGRPAENLLEFYSGGQSATSISSSDIVRHAVGAAQVLASGNFVLVYEPIREILRDGFPGRPLMDEMYAGARAPKAIRWMAPISLLGLGAAVTWFIVTTSRPGNDQARKAALRLSTAWIAVHSGIVILLGAHPGNPEGWMLAIFPAWLAGAAFFIPPRGRILPLGAVVAALLAHNWIGGLWLYADREGDWTAAKAAWLVENTTPSDVILTAQVQWMYVKYWAPARVVPLWLHEVDEVRRAYESSVATASNVFATEDIFDLPPVYRGAQPALADSLERFTTGIRDEFVVVADDPLGRIFVRRADGLHGKTRDAEREIGGSSAQASGSASASAAAPDE